MWKLDLGVVRNVVRNIINFCDKVESSKSGNISFFDLPSRQFIIL